MSKITTYLSLAALTFCFLLALLLSYERRQLHERVETLERAAKPGRQCYHNHFISGIAYNSVSSNSIYVDSVLYSTQSSEQLSFYFHLQLYCRFSLRPIVSRHASDPGAILICFINW